MQIILFNKPYGVLTQFTDNIDGASPDQSKRKTLAEFITQKDFYPAGRLDFHSEGLLLLTDNGELQHRISHPKNKLPKTYWVQVEGKVNPTNLQAIRQGLPLKDGMTQAATVKQISKPANLWLREPPVVAHRDANSNWYQITISEGKNRQVRRMFAYIGHPVLRLIRYSIGSWTLGQLQPGETQVCSVNLPKENMKKKPHAKAKFRR